MNIKSCKSQQGFTIAELLIATAVFSVLLVGILSAFIKISDLFYKGVTMSKTQEDARNIVQSISDDIQFTTGSVNNIYADYNHFSIDGTDVSSYSQTGAFCIGNHKYSFQMGAQVGVGSNYGIGRDTVSPNSCDNTPSATPAVNMLDAGMQLNKLSVDCSSGRRCDVNIHVIYYGGDAGGLFTGACSQDSSCPNGKPELAPDALCTGSIESTDLCATVDYDSTVLENTQ